MPRAEYEVAWAAGFFEGEGSTYAQKRKEYPNFHRPRVSVTQVDREPLERFMNAVGMGRIYGPWPESRPTRQPRHQWIAEGEANVRSFANLLWDGLSNRRRAALCRVLVGEA